MSANTLIRRESLHPEPHDVPSASPDQSQERGGPATAWVDLDALRDVVPSLIGLAPFAMVIGVTLSSLKIPHAAGVLASGLIYGGSAQLAAMDLIAGHADLVSVLLTVVVINSRLLMYGAALEPRFRDQPGWFRWIAPQFIVDQTYALVTNRPELAHDHRRFRHYWLTAGAAIVVVWLGVIGITLAVGPIASSDSPLNFAVTALFIGLLVPKFGEGRSAIAAAAAALVAGLASGLPLGVGLLIGIMAGIAFASFVGERPS